jgi:nitronate monooxygenase
VATSAFLDQLRITHPIIQAPMAGVSTPALAAAVSSAGGLGSLGLGASSVSAAEQAIEATRALTSNPFNVNLFCHQPAVRDDFRERAWLSVLAPEFARFGAEAPSRLNEIYPSFIHDTQMQDMLLKQAPAVVSFHFGLPDASVIEAFKAKGIITLATATSLTEAHAIARAGIDGIVAQGIEAGGHRGVFNPADNDPAQPTFVLLRQLVAETSLPIIAAGGIMDGATISEVLSAGATAAQLGTAFVLCPESSANEAYRSRLQNARAGSTAMTTAISGRPARGLVNRLVTLGETCGVPVADYPCAYDAAKQLNALAAKVGDHDYAAHWAGEGAPLARAMPAEALINILVAELNAAG